MTLASLRSGVPARSRRKLGRPARSARLGRWMSPVAFSRRRSSPTCFSRIATGMPVALLIAVQHLPFRQWLQPRLNKLTEDRAECLQVRRSAQSCDGGFKISGAR